VTIAQYNPNNLLGFGDVDHVPHVDVVQAEKIASGNHLRRHKSRGKQVSTHHNREQKQKHAYRGMLGRSASSGAGAAAIASVAGGAFSDLGLTPF
jgi:hypothetical protein